MARKRRTKSRSVHRKAGMWSAVTAAVQSGWGSTLRLLAVISLRGAFLIGVAVLASESGLFGVLRALLAKLP